MSASPSMNRAGVFTLSIYVIGERALKSASCSQGAPRNHIGVNRVKSAVYQKSRQSAIERCDTAALNRSVWPITQFVRTPPPDPPVTHMRFGSTHRRLI